MKIDFLFPKTPPALDGIGDHTARLAEALAARGEYVRILTAQPDAASISGVTVERAFRSERRHSVYSVVNSVQSGSPDWLVVQYNPFSYGHWGFNPFLPLAIRAIKRTSPRTRVAVIVHEPFVPVESWKFGIMTTWQRVQLWMLGRSADAIFFAIEPWLQRFQSWFPVTPVWHLPVGSNITQCNVSKRAARSDFGIQPEDFVVGVFGSRHHSRLLSFISAAWEGLVADGVSRLRLLYVGATGEEVQAVVGSTPIIDAGALPSEEVSRCFTAMDLYLAPYRKGASTRRGSLMVGLQHGVPTVSTYGVQTDPMFWAQEGEAFLLASDDNRTEYQECVVRLARNANRRAQIGEAGQMFFRDSFCWNRIAEQLMTALDRVTASDQRRHIHQDRLANKSGLSL